MARHRSKARVHLSDFAPTNAIDRRPHIVKNTPLGNAPSVAFPTVLCTAGTLGYSAQHPERLSQRVEQHLVGLERICPHDKRPAV